MRLVLIFFVSLVGSGSGDRGWEPRKNRGRRGEAGEERVGGGSAKRIKSAREKWGEIMQHCLIFRNRKTT